MCQRFSGKRYIGKNEQKSKQSLIKLQLYDKIAVFFLRLKNDYIHLKIKSKITIEIATRMRISPFLKLAISEYKSLLKLSALSLNFLISSLFDL